MLIDSELAMNFRADVVNIACYVTNRCLVRLGLKKTPYELLNGRKSSLSHLKTLGCKCFVLNNGKDDLGKFDARSDEGVFVGYSSTSKAYRVYNKRTMCVEESVHVIFDESGDVSNAEHSEDLEFDELIKVQWDIMIQNPRAGQNSNEERSEKPIEELGPSSVAQEEDSQNEKT
ncbi:hypothetical protein KY285_021913 [Solanum tuberosum]|nr:hypothetical protein KY285_021913 [Solanum tuberosum]